MDAEESVARINNAINGANVDQLTGMLASLCLIRDLPEAVRRALVRRCAVRLAVLVMAPDYLPREQGCQTTDPSPT